MSEKTFDTVGYSIRQGELKLRFTNDRNRTKVLERKGHENIHLFELPQPMTKEDAARWLHSKRGTPADVRQLISQLLNGNVTVAAEAPKPRRRAVAQGGGRARRRADTKDADQPTRAA